MDRVENSHGKQHFHGLRIVPALRNEETIKQGVTILISSEVTSGAPFGEHSLLWQPNTPTAIMIT